MEASAKIKSLLDELAAVLAEMGALQDEMSDRENPMVPGEDEEESAEKKSYDEDEEDIEDAEMIPGEDDDKKSKEEKAAALRKRAEMLEEEEDDEEAQRKARALRRRAAMLDEQKEDEQKERKLRCLCERAEKIRDKVKFFEGVAAKELELRTVLDKATPASEVARRSPAAKEARSVSIYHSLPGAGRLKNFRGANAEERAYRAGQYYKATLMGDKHAARWCADHGVEARALNEGVNSQGGIFVQDEVLNEIIVLVEEYGAWPKNARNIQMKSDTLIVPRRVGGLSAYFVGENTAIPDSDASWDRVQLVAKKCAVSNRMSSEILEDSVLNLADYITGEVSRSLAELIDTVGFVGTGSGSHGGIIGACTKIVDGSHEASVVTAAGGNTGAQTLDIDDLIATAGRLPLFARANARWYCSPAVFAASVQRLGLVNNVGLAGGNTAANLAAPSELRLLGYPIEFVHVMPSTIGADPGKVLFLFGDLSMGAMYATRRGVTFKTSTDRYAELDQTLIVCSTRFDCVTHDCGDNTKAGPIVALKTAAS
jgi:HK97 family phage major capsid protein